MKRSRLLSGFAPGIRIQLTLLYTAIFALLILLFSIFLYIALDAFLTSEVDSALQLRTRQIAAGISFDNGTISVQDATGEVPNLSSNTKSDQGDSQNGPEQVKGSSDVNIGTLVRVTYSSGKNYYTSPAFKALTLPSDSFTQPLHGVDWQGTVSAHNGQLVRLNSIPLTENGHVYGVLQVGESLAQFTATLQTVIIALAIAAPIILLFGAFGSFWLAKRAFRPIDRLTRTAREINAGDLHRRVPVPAARDEVQGLALTLNAMIERLDRAFEQQRRFVADASHELRTPVSVIRSVTDVALEHTLTRKEYTAVLRDINAESERLSRLIHDLLSLARADEGQLTLDRDAVRLDLLAQDVAASMEPLAAERNLTLHVETPQLVTVQGDTARLIQVMMALVDNALTYTNAGGSVRLAVEAGDGQARVSVSDTGIGIGEEAMPHLFERFYRADPARSRAAGGSGLGLAIVDWIVRAHGGAVTVESKEGQGSTFTVVLPLAPPEQTQPLTPVEPQAAGTPPRRH